MDGLEEDSRKTDEVEVRGGRGVAEQRQEVIDFIFIALNLQTRRWEKTHDNNEKKFDLNSRTQRESRLRSNRPIREPHLLLPWGLGRLQLKVRTD